MKRMICIISGQPLPNFIPLNEPATRPDALHAFFTKGDKMMERRWQHLKTVIKQSFPNMQLQGVSLKNAYDPHEIQQECFRVMRQHLQDDWVLNATGGTKLMSAPAIEVFRELRQEIFYVESERNRTLRLLADWRTEELPFQSSVDLTTYFALYGQEISVGESATGQEGNVVRQLQKLDWQVWPSVTLLDQGQAINEYDAIGIRHYQLSAFECKNIAAPNKSQLTQQQFFDEIGKKNDQIQMDLLKLFRLQQGFGGPFGKAYWVFSGSFRLGNAQEARIRDFRINTIRKGQINEISKTPEKFGLPLLKPKRQGSGN